MAITNYDGFSSTTALTIDADGPSGSAGVAVTCHFRYMTFAIFTALFSYQSFCQTSWEEVREGISGASFTWAGYVGGGSVYSAPGSMRGLASTATATMQYAAGCTIVFNPKVASDENGITAGGESARVVSGRANGTPTITWVTV